MTKYYGGTATESNDKASVSFWLIMSILCGFLFIAPFKQALFNGGEYMFTAPIHTAFSWSAVLLLLLSVYLFKNWKMAGRKEILVVFSWMIPGSFVIALLSAKSFYSASNGVFIHTIYIVFFLVGVYCARSNLGKQIITYLIIISAYFLVIYGYLNWFGIINYRDAVLSGRLSNVFQYPNTYAAYLIAIYVVSQVLVNVSAKRYAIMFHSFFLVPIFTSILLTQSRGGFIILPIMFVLYLFFLDWKRQILHVVYLGLTGIVSLFLTQALMSTDHPGTKEWAFLTLSSLVVGVLIFYAETFYRNKLINEGEKPKKYADYIIPSCIIVAGLLFYFLISSNNLTFITSLLPENLKYRIESISLSEKSASSRWEYYVDSFKIIKDYPLFGAGGGGWANLYGVYQSLPYTSSQTHNFFLGYLVETGIIGFLILVTIIGLIYFYFIKSQGRRNNGNLVFFLIPTALLMHSAIDFDMSFLYIGIILFLTIGTMAASYLAKDEIKKFWVRGKKWYSTVLGVLSIGLLIISFQLIYGNTSFKSAQQALQNSEDVTVVFSYLDKAIRSQPSNPTFSLLKIGIMRQAYVQTQNEDFYTWAIAEVNRIEKYEPFNKNIANEKFNLYVTKGDFGHAFEVAYQDLETYPWDLNNYNKLIALNYDLGMQTKESRGERWSEAISVYESFLERKKQITELTPSQQKKYNDFRETPEMALRLGIIFFNEKSYDMAIQVLRKGILVENFDLGTEQNKLIARWYLASQLKTGNLDQDLYDSLIEKYPEEAVELQQLADAQIIN